ncbi:calvin cycle protein cp12-1 chloroplastic [Phtheirospermum japonicum]|uniref:Calvin cycle protein cp12-1 chloroplastic n=1 Tax=Phtheirospermum japonicum TaxID=374723 RepID=A0A830CVD4_9LAMI|nr:calvin cycle protein cp12-1 chloroplastic [Phtheirospermum japonicum]
MLTQSGFQSSTACGGAAPPNSEGFVSTPWRRRRTRYPRRWWRVLRTPRIPARMTPSAASARQRGTRWRS